MTILTAPINNIQTTNPVSRERITPFSLRHEKMLKAKAGKRGYQGTEGYQNYVVDMFDNMAMYANGYLSDLQRQKMDTMARLRYGAWLDEQGIERPEHFFFPEV